MLLQKDVWLEELLIRTKEKLQDHIDAMVVEYSLHPVHVIEEVRTVESWFRMPTKKVSLIFSIKSNFSCFFSNISNEISFIIF